MDLNQAKAELERKLAVKQFWADFGHKSAKVSERIQRVRQYTEDGLFIRAQTCVNIARKDLHALGEHVKSEASHDPVAMYLVNDLDRLLEQVETALDKADQ